jgi:hypothetical protein
MAMANQAQICRYLNRIGEQQYGSLFNEIVEAIKNNRGPEKEEIEIDLLWPWLLEKGFEVTMQEHRRGYHTLENDDQIQIVIKEKQNGFLYLRMKNLKLGNERFTDDTDAEFAKRFITNTMYMWRIHG